MRNEKQLIMLFTCQILNFKQEINQKNIQFYIHERILG
jgi:hypothetical protein